MKIIFDKSNPYWDEDPKWNELFIKSKVNLFNDKLKADGIVLMFEVLEELGYNMKNIPADLVLNKEDKVRCWMDNVGDVIIYQEPLDDGSIILNFDGTVLIDFRCVFKGEL